jgi:hypothetical protein
MNTREIKELLNKYYEGETSLAEEGMLKDFFLSGNVPEELEPEKNQFIYFDQVSADEFDDRDLEGIVFGEKPEVPVVPMHSLRNRIYYITGIAATFLLLIGLFITFREDIFNKPKETANMAEAELAFSQTHDILALVSVNFNKGMDKVQYIGKLDQAMQKMQMLSKYYQYQSIIINPDPTEKGSEKTSK